MRLALLAPVTHRVPPEGYGPWEQVVADLAAGLVQDGHDVTTFAAGGSTPPGHLVPTVPHPLADWPTHQPEPDRRIWEEIHIAQAVAEVRDGGFDVVHSHLSVHPLGYGRLLPTPMVTTLHGVAWNRVVHPALIRFRHLPYVSISDAERRFLPDLNYVATVHDGISPDEFPFGEGTEGYLLFAGRIAPEKAPHLAIEVSKRTGRPLKIAGMVESIHQGYFHSEVAPGLRSGSIEYVGDVTRVALGHLYRGAAALIVPLDWEEPFGLVVIEALMSGTPVVAWRRGAMSELIKDGQTGILVDSVAEAARAVESLDLISRESCRADALARFTSSAMARGYARVYESVRRAQTGTIPSRSSPRTTETNPTPQSENPYGITSVPS